MKNSSKISQYFHAKSSTGKAKAITQAQTRNTNEEKNQLLEPTTATVQELKLKKKSIPQNNLFSQIIRMILTLKDRIYYSVLIIGSIMRLPLEMY